MTMGETMRPAPASPSALRSKGLPETHFGRIL
jgi:hypothetical protein